jgi:hypothetical protein
VFVLIAPVVAIKKGKWLDSVRFRLRLGLGSCVALAFCGGVSMLIFTSHSEMDENTRTRYNQATFSLLCSIWIGSPVMLSQTAWSSLVLQKEMEGFEFEDKANLLFRVRAMFTMSIVCGVSIMMVGVTIPILETVFLGSLPYYVILEVVQFYLFWFIQLGMTILLIRSKVASVKTIMVRSTSQKKSSQKKSSQKNDTEITGVRHSKEELGTSYARMESSNLGE